MSPKLLKSLLRMCFLAMKTTGIGMRSWSMKTKWILSPKTLRKMKRWLIRNPLRLLKKWQKRMNQGMRTQKETKSLKRISITKRSNLNRPKKSWKRFRRRNKRPDHLQIFSTTMTTYKNQLKKNKKRKSIRNESRKRLLVKKSQALLPQRVSPKSLKMWLLRSKRRN